MFFISTIIIKPARVILTPKAILKVRLTVENLDSKVKHLHIIISFVMFVTLLLLNFHL